MADVTVVIPAFNREGMIGDAVRSALPNRVLVVDDGSTDGTVAAAREAGADVIECDHVGMTANFNRAVSLARSEYVCWLGSDDVYLPGKVEKQLAQMADCDVSFTGIGFAADGSSAWNRAVAGLPLPGHGPDISRYTREFKSFQKNVATGTAMFRKVAWIPWDEGIVTGGADLLWVYQMAARGYRFAVVPDVLYVARKHAGRQLYERRRMDQEVVNAELDRVYWPAVARIGKEWDERIAREARFPVYALDGVTSAACFFCAGFLGKNVEEHVRNAGIRDVVAVDADAAKIERMRPAYPGWTFVAGDAYEAAAGLRAVDRNFDIVTVDSDTTQMQTVLDDLEGWKALASKWLVVGVPDIATAKAYGAHYALRRSGMAAWAVFEL